jgi:hypothetical protein
MPMTAVAPSAATMGPAPIAERVAPTPDFSYVPNAATGHNVQFGGV